MSEMSQVGKEKLVSDFKQVVADAEELLKATAGTAGDKMGEMRIKVQEHLSAAKIRLADLEATVVDKSKAAARATDDYVHDNPWRAVGVAAGVGLIIGLLIGRR